MTPALIWIRGLCCTLISPLNQWTGWFVSQRSLSTSPGSSRSCSDVSSLCSSETSNKKKTGINKNVHATYSSALELKIWIYYSKEKDLRYPIPVGSSATVSWSIDLTRRISKKEYAKPYFTSWNLSTNYEKINKKPHLLRLPPTLNYSSIQQRFLPSTYILLHLPRWCLPKKERWLWRCCLEEAAGETHLQYNPLSHRKKNELFFKSLPYSDGLKKRWSVRPQAIPVLLEPLETCCGWPMDFTYQLCLASD